VLFSADRVRAPGSNSRPASRPAPKVVKVDDLHRRRDPDLAEPDPERPVGHLVHHVQEVGGGEQCRRPDACGATSPTFASLNANGTGPFKIESHQPGVKTVFKVNENWWKKPEHNIKEIIFTPIASDATRVAALLSGEVDVIEPVPIQDIQRVNVLGQRPGPDRAGAAHDLPRHGPDP
jgi:peptide/nickel transport system substrate-binding protein